MISKRIHLEYLKGLKGFLMLLRDPKATDSVFEIVEGFRETAAYRHAWEHVRSVPESAQIIEERYIPPTPDLKNLSALPEGTLGRVYADHMIRLGLDPAFFPKIEATDDIAFMMLRMREAHDIWHVVAGFATDVPGELGLQAFGLAQTHNPLSIALIGGGLLRTLKSATELDAIMNEVSRGWRRGREAAPFFAQRWEAGWELPIAEWRRDLGIEV